MAGRTIDLGFSIPAYGTDAEIWQGEDIILQFTRYNGTTIAGYTITGYLRKYHDDADPTLTITGALVSSGSTGIFTLTLTAAQTAALANQGYIMEVWRTDSGSVTLLSTVLLTVLEGTQA